MFNFLIIVALGIRARIITTTFLVGKNFFNVIGIRGSCSRRSTDWTSCFLPTLDVFFPLERRCLVLLPCLFLQRTRGGWSCLCFLDHHLVTRVHPSSSSSRMPSIGSTSITVVGNHASKLYSSPMKSYLGDICCYVDGQSLDWTSCASSKPRMIIPSLGNCILCVLDVMHFSRGRLMTL